MRENHLYFALLYKCKLDTKVSQLQLHRISVNVAAAGATVSLSSRENLRFKESDD